MKQLVLHVGSHKTGTTTLQKFMVENAQAFEEKGLYVPITPSKYPLTNKNRTACFLKYLVRGNLGYPTWNDDVKDLVEKDREVVMRAIEEHDAIYLSDERIWFDGAQNERYWGELKSAAEGLGIDSFKVVVYLRRQDEFLVSLWAQLAKKNMAFSLNDYLMKPRNEKAVDYLANLRVMEQAFGRDNMIVRVYDRATLINGDICCDFCDAIGIEWSEQFKPVVSQNPSLSTSMAEIMRIANSTPSYRKTDGFLTRMAQRTSSSKGKSLSAVSASELNSVLESFAEDNAVIAKEYLGREDGVLFDSTAELSDITLFTPKMLYDMCFFFSDVLASEHAKRLQLEEEVKRLREQVNKEGAQLKKIKKENTRQRKRVDSLERCSLIFRLKRFIKNKKG